VASRSSVRPVSGVWTIVVGAGVGTRFGGAKQYEELAGRRIVDRSVSVAVAHSEGVVVVLPTEDVGDAGVRAAGATDVVAGGATRSASVREGLAAVPDDAGIVLVHDAARPLADSGVFGRVLAAVRAGASAAVPVVDVVDTVCGLDGRFVDRSDLRVVQTPQGFEGAALRAAHSAGGEATDDATLVRQAGGTVVLVEGDRANLKVTEPLDLVIARALFAARRGDGGDSTS